MAARTQLPGIRGHAHLFAVIVVGVVLTIIGMPGRASAHPKPHPVMRKVGTPVDAELVRALPPAAPPSPHPAPGRGSPLTRPSMSRRAAPAPAPQTPPTQRPADVDIAFPHPVAVPGANLRAAAVTRPGSRSREASAKQSHASRAIAPDRLAQSLVYSSGLALAIAAGGLILIGSRRRLW